MHFLITFFFFVVKLKPRCASLPALPPSLRIKLLHFFSSHLSQENHLLSQLCFPFFFYDTILRFIYIIFFSRNPILQTLNIIPIWKGCFWAAWGWFLVSLPGVLCCFAQLSRSFSIDFKGQTLTPLPANSGNRNLVKGNLKNLKGSVEILFGTVQTWCCHVPFSCTLCYHGGN